MSNTNIDQAILAPQSLLDAGRSICEKEAISKLDPLLHVASSYLGHAGAIPNGLLYKKVAQLAGIPKEKVSQRDPVGENGKMYSLFGRQVRWHQQTLKRMGVLERTERGSWKLTEKGKAQLTKADPEMAILGFSTKLGVAIWGSCERVFGGSFNEPITLCVTSPPYLLRKPRAYGNPSDEREYIDFICRSMEPVVKNLVKGGSVCLNISNDVFEQGSPARSMYVERLLLDLHDRLGLHLMDRLIWENPNKPPGPIAWASKQRVQLNVGYEPVYWMTNDPMSVRSDNRRVLQAHTESHLKLIRGGGEKRDSSACDGAYNIRAGKSFANETAGKIPRNIIKISSTCHDKRALSKIARELGLPVHGATMPLGLAKFLIQFLSEEGDLVVDTFGGWVRTGKAAEELNRRWMVSELMGEYVLGGAESFKECDGFERALS